MERTFRAGQRFTIHDVWGFKNHVILSQVDTSIVTLVCLKDGNRWSKTIKVNSAYDIKENEFKEVCGDCCKFITQYNKKSKRSKIVLEFKEK